MLVYASNYRFTCSGSSFHLGREMMTVPDNQTRVLQKHQEALSDSSIPWTAIPFVVAEVAMLRAVVWHVTRSN